MSTPEETTRRETLDQLEDVRSRLDFTAYGIAYSVAKGLEVDRQEVAVFLALHADRERLRGILSDLREA